MRMRKMVLALLCVALVGMLVPASAGAAFSNSRYDSADAWYTSWDWELGVEPGPNVAAEDRFIGGSRSSSIWRDGKTSTELVRETSGVVWISSYTPAVGESPRTWTEFSCLSLEPAFSIGKKLSSAKLEFMAPGETRIWRGAEPWIETEEGFEMRDPDEVIDAGMVSVVGDWTPTGPVARSRYMNKERSTDFSYSDHSQQSYRDANAKALVVGADGTIYWSATIPGNISQGKSVSRFPDMF